MAAVVVYLISAFSDQPVQPISPRKLNMQAKKVLLQGSSRRRGVEHKWHGLTLYLQHPLLNWTKRSFPNTSEVMLSNVLVLIQCIMWPERSIVEVFQSICIMFPQECNLMCVNYSWGTSFGSHVKKLFLHQVLCPPTIYSCTVSDS